jgi:hypothetical protein
MRSSGVPGTDGVEVDVPAGGDRPVQLRPRHLREREADRAADVLRVPARADDRVANSGGLDPLELVQAALSRVSQ